MYKVLSNLRRIGVCNKNYHEYYVVSRNFLSQAYYCNEVWDHRLRSPILERVNLDELYQDLDQRFNKTRKISAVDVDIFANAVKGELFVDELLDLIHKLRLSADTGNTLNSTSHAVIRYLSSIGRNEELLNVLDDRLNYGVFLDYFTTNILLDTYYKKRDFVSGARIASQLMLQEDFSHPLNSEMSLLHCYNFLLNPVGWPELPTPEEPEEEIKIRVKYLRNPYYDDHFDITDPLKIVGKTICMITKNTTDTLQKSLHLVGLVLYGKHESAVKLINNLNDKKEKVYAEVLNLIPKDNEIIKETSKLETESADINTLLEAKVKQTERLVAEKDVALQCELYLKWESERKDVLNKQLQRLMVAKRLANIEEVQKQLKERETKLWFFEKEEEIELKLEHKKIYKSKQRPNNKKPNKIDESYVPPEVHSKHMA